MQQPLANRPREASPLWYQQQQALSNVVEIDDVEVNPIDDPFYDPQNPTSSTDKSRLSAQAVLSDDNSTSSVPQPRSNAVAIDEVDFEGFTAPLLEEAGVSGQQPPADAAAGRQQAAAAVAADMPRTSLGGRPMGDSSMPDFPSGGLDLVQYLNLDGIMLQNKATIIHEGKGPPIPIPKLQQPQGPGQDSQQEQQLQQQASPTAQTEEGSKRHRDKRHKQALQQGQAAAVGSTKDRGDRASKQQRQQEQPGVSQPRPHPFYVKPRHVKKHFKVTTVDGWKLHLIRTQVVNVPATQHHPVILCPGLGSSGAYSFDLSPNVSLADYLAGKGWDVWTCELRGNGLSDKPALFSSRSSSWTIDDYVEKDVPAIIRFVLKETKAQQVHFLGHSMGGMILCGVMARVDITTAKIRSCICMGSGLYLEESWWRLFDRFRYLLNSLWVVPSGSLLRAYSRVMFGPYRIPYIDSLYFWDSNVDHRVGRAMMQRNFSNISVGVIKQMTTAFGDKGLLSHDRKMVYADPGRLAKVTAPALFLVGDRDRMCPPEGCRKTWQMLGSKDKRYVCLGPASGFADHYGHFDILMGKRVEVEVFPIIHQFLLQHDGPRPRL